MARASSVQDPRQLDHDHHFADVAALCDLGRRITFVRLRATARSSRVHEPRAFKPLILSLGNSRSRRSADDSGTRVLSAA